MDVREEMGDLHRGSRGERTKPSWEAKKRMKEKEPAAIIPSARKKIVF